MVEWILGRMEKKKGRENKEGKLFRRCLVGRGRGENDSGARMFSPRARQNVFSPKWRELGRENVKVE